MPTFDDAAETTAPPEEVWKLLYDPARFPDWWAGIGTVEADDGAPSRYTMYPDGWPDFPMPQELRADRAGGRVTVSCLVNDLVFAWRLVPASAGTSIEVHVELPEREAHRLEDQRALISASLRNLAALAATASPPAPG